MTDDAWENPVKPLNFEGMAQRDARTRACAVDPSRACQGTSCMAWLVVFPGKEPDHADQQGHCVHVLHKTTDIQVRMREQLEAAIEQRERHEMSSQHIPKLAYPAGKSN